jgi:hypothetical protein
MITANHARNAQLLFWCLHSASNIRNPRLNHHPRQVASPTPVKMRAHAFLIALLALTSEVWRNVGSLHRSGDWRQGAQLSSARKTSH